MHFKKKLWYFLSILSTLLLVVLPISGCSSSFNVESTTETRTYTSTITNNSDKNTSDTSQSDNAGTASSKKKQIDETDDYLDKNGSYTSKEDVTNYLIQYRQLPMNFYKKRSKKTGLVRRKLRSLGPSKCIGGDYFSNYEQRLPVVSGRTYHECDIDTLNAKSRGAKRIIYSDDGQIYYTDDHYETFTLLYGDDIQ